MNAKLNSKNVFLIAQALMIMNKFEFLENVSMFRSLDQPMVTMILIFWLCALFCFVFVLVFVLIQYRTVVLCECHSACVIITCIRLIRVYVTIA